MKQSKKSDRESDSGSLGSTDISLREITPTFLDEFTQGIEHKNYIVYSLAEEGQIFWQLIFPAASKLAGGRKVVLIGPDFEGTITDQDFPLLCLDCSKLSRDQLLLLTRREKPAALAEVFNQNRNFMIYVHSMGDSQEKLGPLLSILLDEFSNVILSGVHGRHGLRNCITPHVTSRAAIFAVKTMSSAGISVLPPAPPWVKVEASIEIKGKNISVKLDPAPTKDPGVYCVIHKRTKEVFYVGETGKGKANLYSRLKFLFRCAEQPHPCHPNYRRSFGKDPTASDFGQEFFVYYLSTRGMIGRLEIEEWLQEKYRTNKKDFYDQFRAKLGG